MKIPESSPNVGAYYGNEENGQWQPNGVIIESIGGGDATLHRPPVYPVHIPRGHMPMEAGYVMAGGYYAPPFAPAAPPPTDDFADYMWMEHLEEFDKEVMQQLEEEALMEQCIEAMLEDERERERQRRPTTNGHRHQPHSQHPPHYPTTSSNMSTELLEETLSRSTLNPLAAEFVPIRVRSAQSEATPEPPATVANAEEIKEETKSSVEEKQNAPAVTQEDGESNTKLMPTPQPTETPEVSAADVQPIVSQERRPKTTQKEVRKSKSKPQPAKSETKMQQPKTKEVKAVKSEVRADDEKTVEEKMEIPAPEPVKNLHSPVEEPKVVAQPEFKPINYAAAAKAAAKPKPKPTTPPNEKTPPPTKAPTLASKPEKKSDPKLSKSIDNKKESEKREKVSLKDKVKSERTVKPEKVTVQRKNSAK